jgi:hypothetical protein
LLFALRPYPQRPCILSYFSSPEKPHVPRRIYHACSIRIRQTNMRSLQFVQTSFRAISSLCCPQSSSQPYLGSSVGNTYIIRHCLADGFLHESDVRTTFVFISSWLCILHIPCGRAHDPWDAAGPTHELRANSRVRSPYSCSARPKENRTSGLGGMNENT